VLILSLSIVASFVLFYVDTLNWTLPGTPNTVPVSVSGNSDLATQFARVTSDGLSWETAYIIQNYNIDLDYEEDFHGIHLENTNYFTIIRNSILSKQYYHSIDLYGIYLKNCSNVRIINCNVWGFTTGLYLDNCSNIAVSDCTLNSNDDNGIYSEKVTSSNYTDNTIYYNNYGINLYRANDCIVDNNEMLTNDVYDIYYRWSNSTVFTNNIMGSGFYLEGQGYDNSIDLTNTVNGKPVYYYHDTKDLNIEYNQRIGQLILLNCSNSIFKNAIITGSCYAVQSFKSSHNTFQNFSIKDIYSSAFYLVYADNNTVCNNSLSNMRDTGIYIYESYNSTIRYNYILTTMVKGIELRFGENCTVYNNTIDIKRKSYYDDYYHSYDSYGIYIYNTENNSIISNLIDYEADYGLYFYYSDHNNISLNILHGMGSAFSFDSSENNNFTFNKCYHSSIGLSLVGNNIDTSNTLNDESIYFLCNENNTEFDGIEDISILLLYNCKNITIKSMEFDNTSISTINLSNCQNVTITNLTIQNVDTAIYLTGCNNITADQNFISYVRRGIREYSSYNIRIINNQLNHGALDGTGIYIDSSHDNIILNNTISFPTAIYGWYMDNTVIKNNTLTHATNYALDMQCSDSNNVTLNEVFDSLVGFYIYYSFYDIIKNNNMTDVVTCILLEYPSETNEFDQNTCIYRRREAPEFGIMEIIIILIIASVIVVGAVGFIYLMIYRFESKITKPKAKRNVEEVRKGI
jgi:parallel beta-helix repeat protein